MAHFHFHVNKQEKTTVDRAMTAAAIIHPLTAIPQVLKIYQTQNVAGLSIFSWVAFMLIGAIFLAYALVHKIKPLILTQVIWFVMDALIVAGILMYR